MDQNSNQLAWPDYRGVTVCVVIPTVRCSSSWFSSVCDPNRKWTHLVSHCMRTLSNWSRVCRWTLFQNAQSFKISRTRQKQTEKRLRPRSLLRQIQTSCKNWCYSVHLCLEKTGFNDGVLEQLYKVPSRVHFSLSIVLPCIKKRKL